MSKKRPPKPKRKRIKLGSKKDGLTWTWKWPAWNFDEYQGCWHGGPGYQSAAAKRKTKFGTLELETLEWSNDKSHYYSVSISLGGQHVYSSGSFDREFATRLEAQISAEAKVKDLAAEITRVTHHG